MPKEEKVPFMVSVLLAFGAWLACLAALFFFALRNMIWFGAAFICVAAACRYAESRSIEGALKAFLAHASLAFSLFGKGMLFFGITDLWGLNAGGCLVLLTVMVAVSYPLFTQGMDRAVTVFAAAWCAFAWLWELRVPLVYMETLSVAFFAAAYALLMGSRALWRPLAWGLLPACAMPVFIGSFGPEAAAAFGGLNQVLLGALLCGFYAWQMRKDFNMLLAVLILVLAFVSNSGVCMGAALLALGFAQNNRLLKAAGAGVFALALCWLYFHLQTTLLVKAYYLCASGILLLGAYAWLKRGNYAR